MRALSSDWLDDLEKSEDVFWSQETNLLRPVMPWLTPPVYPEETTCTGCHNKADVAKKTKALEPNPHTAPHNGDCTLCHMQHEPAVNYCAQCHNFNFKVR